MTRARRTIPTQEPGKKARRMQSQKPNQEEKARENESESCNYNNTDSMKMSAVDGSNPKTQISKRYQIGGKFTKLGEFGKYPYGMQARTQSESHRNHNPGKPLNDPPKKRRNKKKGKRRALNGTREMREDAPSSRTETRFPELTWRRF